MRADGDAQSDEHDDATQFLDRIRQGDGQAAEELFPMVYAELRARAGAYFRGQPGNHTLQPTGLVHEAYLKLVQSPGQGWNNRVHFCAVAATAMRQILVDHARRRQREERDRAARGAMSTMLGLEDGTDFTADVLDLDQALQALAEEDASAARMVELRFFGGLTFEEAALTLGRSVPALKRDWRGVRAWLVRRLRGEDA